MLSSKFILLLTFVLAFVLFCSGHNNATCPNTFVRINSKCYFIEQTKVNWFKAFRRCRQLNAELLTIYEEHERRVLTEHLRRSGYQESWPNSFWTSGTKLGEDSDWYWQSSGVKVPMSNWLWHFGEPNNPKVEQCISIFYANNGYFANDAPCDYPFMYICERPLMLGNETSEYYISESVVLVKNSG